MCFMADKRKLKSVRKRRREKKNDQPQFHKKQGNKSLFYGLIALIIAVFLIGVFLVFNSGPSIEEQIAEAKKKSAYDSVVSAGKIHYLCSVMRDEGCEVSDNGKTLILPCLNSKGQKVKISGYWLKLNYSRVRLKGDSFSFILDKKEIFGENHNGHWEIEINGKKSVYKEKVEAKKEIEPMHEKKELDYNFHARISSNSILALPQKMVDVGVIVSADGKTVTFPCYSAEGKQLVFSGEWESLFWQRDQLAEMAIFFKLSGKKEIRLYKDFSSWKLFVDGDNIGVHYSDKPKQKFEPKKEEPLKEISVEENDKADISDSNDQNYDAKEYISEDGLRITKLPRELIDLGVEIYNLDSKSRVNLPGQYIKQKGAIPNSSIVAIPAQIGRQTFLFSLRKNMQWIGIRKKDDIWYFDILFNGMRSGFTAHFPKVPVYPSRIKSPMWTIQVGGNAPMKLPYFFKNADFKDDFCFMTRYDLKNNSGYAEAPISWISDSLYDVLLIQDEKNLFFYHLRSGQFTADFRGKYPLTYKKFDMIKFFPFGNKNYEIVLRPKIKGPDAYKIVFTQTKPYSGIEYELWKDPGFYGKLSNGKVWIYYVDPIFAAFGFKIAFLHLDDQGAYIDYNGNKMRYQGGNYKKVKNRKKFFKQKILFPTMYTVKGKTVAEMIDCQNLKLFHYDPDKKKYYIEYMEGNQRRGYLFERYDYDVPTFPTYASVPLVLIEGYYYNQKKESVLDKNQKFERIYNPHLIPSLEDYKSITKFKLQDGTFRKIRITQRNGSLFLYFHLGIIRHNRGIVQVEIKNINTGNFKAFIRHGWGGSEITGDSIYRHNFGYFKIHFKGEEKTLKVNNFDHDNFFNIELAK